MREKGLPIVSHRLISYKAYLLTLTEACLTRASLPSLVGTASGPIEPPKSIVTLLVSTCPQQGARGSLTGP